MPAQDQFVLGDLRAQHSQSFQRPVFLGTLLQWSLRVLLIVFIAVTLFVEPPRRNALVCVTVLAAYVVTVGCWSGWALRPVHRPAVRTKERATLLVLGADIAVIAVLSALTGLTAPEDWTSDVLRNGLFLIPLIAAAQLSPRISGMIAIPTVVAFVATSWITKSSNDEPWASILLSTTVLAGLAAGSVALSRIQRSKVETIEQLAGQRTQLLEQLLGLEKDERQALAERVHDGALQYVLVARQDLDDVRGGSAEAVVRVESALGEASQLLRDVARELHPEVLARLGLKSALAHLAASVGTRSDLAVEVDSQTWPDDERSDADHVLYSAARELLTNAVKHARAHEIRIGLENAAGIAKLTVVDDGVGISPAALSQSLEGGHIGLASIRTKVLASGGNFSVRTNLPGTEVTISIPLRQSAPGSEFGPNAVMSAITTD
ncbi:MAG: two-component system, NarL family, sensor kinase [Mycobacterium sp.]|jgi:two-component system NarL family sensor kinase|nr:two-component system, NarL family, sensor kinase [Mycobacterium sp.]